VSVTTEVSVEARTAVAPVLVGVGIEKSYRKGIWPARRNGTVL